MANQFGLNDASRIIDVIDGRIQRNTRSGAKVEYTWGTIASVAADGRTAGAYIYGETDGAYISDGFRVPETSYVTVGDAVKVAMDYGTGERWVDEVNVSSAYQKITVDIKNGIVTFGSGAAVGDTNLYREMANQLRTDDTMHSVGGFKVTSPSSTDSQGYAAYMASLPNNGYTGYYQRIGTEANPVFKIAGGGLLEWGAGGASAVDVNLYRQATNVLKTDDTFVAPGIYVGSDTTAGQTSDGLNIGGGSIEMRSANPFIDFKTTNEDYGARIIYDYNITDGIEFTGAVKYSFDNTMRLTTGDLESDSTFDFFTLASAAQQLKAKSILLSTSFSDPTPNSAGVQFGADVNLYRSATDVLKTDDSLEVAGQLSIGGSAGSSGSSTTFSINNGGTATFTSKLCEWFKYGRLVVFRLSFSVSANGSGTTSITVTNTGLPSPANTTFVGGDRGGTGVTFLGARFAGGDFTAIRHMADISNVQGADLVSGAGYSFNGAYLAAS